MTVLLRTSADLPAEDAYAAWLAVAGARPAADPARRVADLAARLERSFDAIARDWLDLGRELARDPSAPLSHLPNCAANISDFGEMLAWARTVSDLAAEDDGQILAICDDPWMFRHLSATLPVEAGRPPAFGLRPQKLALRGWAARTRYALRAAADRMRLASWRRGTKPGGSWILVYGHPASDAEGRDGYFGDLPQRLPSLSRVLHVDCPPVRARELAADGRTTSLRAWGPLAGALTLPFARWRPARTARTGEYGWLIRRAEALEGGTAQAAAIRWQILCQRAWLAAQRPRTVAWPWEGHSWERVFVADARKQGARTAGYQHSVIGRQMLNNSPRSAPADRDVLPDVILCTGRSTRDQLAAWNVPPGRLAIGGALRVPRSATVRHDPAAPAFVALPFDHVTSAEMVTAVEACAGPGRAFLVRAHPMTPYPFRPSAYVRVADGPLGTQAAVSAVVYAATTVGLEAVIAGLPTIRFRSPAHLSIDILPPSVEVPAADSQSLPDALLEVRPPAAVNREDIFAAPDPETWRTHLEPS